MPQTIAFISEHASPLAQPGSIDCGGQNVYVMELARQLERADYSVDIYTRRDREDQEETVQWTPKIRVIHIKGGPGKPIPKEFLITHMPEFLHRMLLYIRQHRLQYELFHAHFFMSGSVASQLKKILGIPYVITFHALGHTRHLHQGEKDLFPVERMVIEKNIMEDADAVIAECPQDKADMLLFYNAPPHRIRMVPCGIDPTMFYPEEKQKARTMLGLDPERHLLLHVGRMVPRKGIDNILMAMSHLEDTNARLLIIGGTENESEEWNRLKNIVRETGIKDKVQFLGQLNGSVLRSYYSAADLFLTTPWYEPFGITPLEAMACGTPVVGADVGGIKYSVLHGKTGWLLPPKTPIMLAKAVNNLLRRRQLLNEMGAQAHYRAHHYFTWQKVGEQIMKTYQEVIDRHHAEQRHRRNLNEWLPPAKVSW